MLYSLIPPALVVLSLVGIIIFLMKKASAVADLESQLIQAEENTTGARESFLGKIKSRGLWFLEKIFQGFRFLFLKLVKIFSVWGELIRRKRNSKIEGKRPQYSEGKKEEKLNLAQAERIDEIFQRRERNIQLKEEISKEKSDETLAPVNNPVEKKDIFEKILIERIAANPKDIEAYERLGEYYFEIENWDYAKDCFKQVVKLNPGNRNVKIKIRKLERLLGDK